MNAATGAPEASAAKGLALVDAVDERALLAAFDDLLAREEALLARGDVSDLVHLAAERERLSMRLFEAATARRRSDPGSATQDAELIALVRGLRRRHDTRAAVIRVHETKNARALGVLAQAGGGADLYRADGRPAPSSPRGV